MISKRTRHKAIVDKPNFLKCVGHYALRFAVVGIVAILICTWGAQNYYEEKYMAEADSACEIVYKQAEEFIRDYYRSYMVNPKKAELRYKLISLWEDYHICSSIGVDESLLVASEESAVLLCSTEEKEFYFYLDYASVGDRLDNILKTLKDMGIDYRDCIFYVDSAYVLWNSRFFQPEQLTVVRASDNEVLVEVELDNATHISSNKIEAEQYSYNFPMQMKYLGNPECTVRNYYKYVKEISVSRVATYESDSACGTLYNHQENNPHNHIIESEVANITNGVKYNLVMQSDYSYIANLYKQDAKALTIRAMIYVIATLVIATMFCAVINYYKKLSVYNLFEYRRQTTDAMTHDLKTPLAIASAYVENLKENISEDKREQYLNSIDESIQYMNRLINDILDFSNSQYCNDNLSKDSVSLLSCVEKIQTMLEPACAKRQLTIDVEGYSVIKADRKLLEQALLNLLANSVKYASENSKITVKIDKKSVIIQNTTENTINNIDKILEPYVKGDTYRGENTGSGLGLAIADNNLKKLGYKLSVEFADKTFTAKIDF